MKKTKLQKRMPQFNRAKLIRLAVFLVLIIAGFTLNKYVPEIRTFGWGFTFGIAAMASLTG